MNMNAIICLNGSEGVVALLFSLIPILGYSTSSVYGGGSRFSGDSSGKDDTTDKKEKIRKIKEEIKELTNQISGLVLVRTGEAEDLVFSLLAKRKQLRKQLADMDKDEKAVQQIEEIDREIRYIGQKISSLQQTHGGLDEFMLDTIEDLWNTYRKLKEELKKLLGGST